MLQITEEGKVQKAKCELHPTWPHFIEVRARRVNLHDLLISASNVSNIKHLTLVTGPRGGVGAGEAGPGHEEGGDAGGAGGQVSCDWWRARE